MALLLPQARTILKYALFYHGTGHLQKILNIADAPAVHSGIPALMKFARQKLKRLDGLVAHAKFHINTGRLEGFNNKIKVAKRNAYGFKNLDFFFSYIRFISLPQSAYLHQFL